MYTEQNKLMYNMDILQDPPAAACTLPISFVLHCVVLEAQSFLVYVVQNWQHFVPVTKLHEVKKVNIALLNI